MFFYENIEQCCVLHDELEVNKASLVSSNSSLFEYEQKLRLRRFWDKLQLDKADGVTFTLKGKVLVTAVQAPVSICRGGIGLLRTYRSPFIT